MILNMMFNNGENSLISAQWELLDTPPAKSWRNMIEHGLENPKEDPLDQTDAVFCATVSEAQLAWQTIRNNLTKLNHMYAKLPFANLKVNHTTKLLDDLTKILTHTGAKNIDRAYEVKETIDLLKNVMFYFDRVKDNEFNNGNEGSAFGAIMYSPDPRYGVAFKPEWLEYTTFDIVPGTVYADIGYDGLPWHRILELGPIENAYEHIKLKRFGAPTFMGNGYTIPFNQDLGGIEAELIKYFYDNYTTLKYLDPSFDPVYALKCSGRIPVARLITKLGEKGYPGYEELAKIESMFKLELYESY